MTFSKLWLYAALSYLPITTPLFAETIDSTQSGLPQQQTDTASDTVPSPVESTGNPSVVKESDAQLNPGAEGESSYDRAHSDTGLNSIGSHLYVFGGNAQIEDTTVTATEGCFICWNNTVTKQVNGWSGNTAGIHLDEWFNQKGSPLLLGIAGELSHTNADAPGVAVSYDVIAITPQIGYSFYSTDEAAKRALRAYLGINISVIMQGDASVSFPEFTHKVSPPVSGNGTGFILGASASYRRFDTFVELRSMSMSISSDADLNFSGDTIDVTIDSTQVMVGVGYRIN